MNFRDWIKPAESCQSTIGDELGYKSVADEAIGYLEK